MFASCLWLQTGGLRVRVQDQKVSDDRGGEYGMTADGWDGDGDRRCRAMEDGWRLVHDALVREMARVAGVAGVVRRE